MCTGPEALALEASATRENIDEWESSYNQNNTIYIEWPPRSGLIVARIFPQEIGKKCCHTDTSEGSVAAAEYFNILNAETVASLRSAHPNCHQLRTEHVSFSRKKYFIKPTRFGRATMKTVKDDPNHLNCLINHTLAGQSEFFRRACEIYRVIVCFFRSDSSEVKQQQIEVI